MCAFSGPLKETSSSTWLTAVWSLMENIFWLLSGVGAFGWLMNAFRWISVFQHCCHVVAVRCISCDWYSYTKQCNASWDSFVCQSLRRICVLCWSESYSRTHTHTSKARVNPYIWATHTRRCCLVSHFTMWLCTMLNLSVAWGNCSACVVGTDRMFGSCP